jgi:hypothetical protein
VEKRFHSGGVLSANYTYAKSLADVESAAGVGGNGASATPNTGGGVSYSAQNSGNLRGGEYSLASFDLRNRFVASYVLPLPFGEGQAFGHYHGVAGALVSGWVLNGITTIQNGFPISIQQAGNVSALNSYGYTVRSTRAANCDATIKGSGKNRLSGWFNTSCFSSTNVNPTTASLVLGNEPRVDPQVRTDGLANWDFSFLKTTKVSEKLGLQFRAELFNAFNHPLFSAPDNTVTDGSFGQVTNQANNPRLVQFSLRVNY